MIKKICLVCRKEFKTWQCHLLDKKYCSMNCYNISKKGKPTWNKGLTILPIIKCLTCGKKVKSENRRRKFCSRKCFLIGPRKQKDLIDRICKQCGKEFKVYPSVINRGSGKFCSQKCYTMGQSGEGSSNWRGGISFEPYSVDWTETLKKSIRERDNYICQECGLHQDELDRKLDIHHIDYDKKNCNPDNLITLCRSCHNKTNHNRKYWINYFKTNLINL